MDKVSDQELEEKILNARILAPDHWLRQCLDELREFREAAKLGIDDGGAA
jgi:hypothetical protein